jgi:HD-GYP domain-containing protein (c-di-GMP phosphodiesterase class II)
MFDGSGYPRGGQGEEIPWERVSSRSPTRTTQSPLIDLQEARSAQAALAEIERCAGTQFDPQLVEIFAEAMREFAKPAASDEAVSAQEASA